MKKIVISLSIAGILALGTYGSVVQAKDSGRMMIVSEKHNYRDSIPGHARDQEAQMHAVLNMEDYQIQYMGKEYELVDYNKVLEENEGFSLTDVVTELDKSEKPVEPEQPVEPEEEELEIESIT